MSLKRLDSRLRGNDDPNLDAPLEDDLYRIVLEEFARRLVQNARAWRAGFSLSFSRKRESMPLK